MVVRVCSRMALATAAGLLSLTLLAAAAIQGDELWPRDATGAALAHYVTK